jgi:hypothetical protein
MRDRSEAWTGETPINISTMRDVTLDTASGARMTGPQEIASVVAFAASALGTSPRRRLEEVRRNRVR